MIVKREGDPMLSELLELVKGQQEQLNEVIKKVASLGLQQGGQRRAPAYDLGGQPVCFRSREPGHIARNCLRVMNVSQQSRVPREPGVSRPVQTNVKEVSGN